MSADRTICIACDGRGWVPRRTGYLKTVTGSRYRNGIARDFCFDCNGTGTKAADHAD